MQKYLKWIAFPDTGEKASKCASLISVGIPEYKFLKIGVEESPTRSTLPFELLLHPHPHILHLLRVYFFVVRVNEEVLMHNNTVLVYSMFQFYDKMEYAVNSIWSIY